MRSMKLLSHCSFLLDFLSIVCENWWVSRFCPIFIVIIGCVLLSLQGLVSCLCHFLLISWVNSKLSTRKRLVKLGEAQVMNYSLTFTKGVFIKSSIYGPQCAWPFEQTMDIQFGNSIVLSSFPITRVDVSIAFNHSVWCTNHFVSIVMWPELSALFA